MHYRLRHRRHRLLLRAPLRTAHGWWSEREVVWVQLEHPDGVRRYGEASPIPWFGTETADEIEAVLRDLGMEVDDARLDAVPVRLGCLRAALAAARAEVPAPANLAAWPVAALLPAGRPALTVIEPLAEAGFRIFKWKVGVADVADELGLLDDLCARLPSGGRLRLDANGSWDRRAAERWLERCAERPVEFVEQPCFAAAKQGKAAGRKAEDVLLGLAADYPTSLALDESLVSDGDVQRWLQMGWPGVFVLKLALLGDAPAALKALQAAGAKVVFSSALETAVGAKAALRRAFAWPGTRQALGFGVWPLFSDARFDGPAAAPFLRWADVAAIDEEAAWNAPS
ncbi:MAG: o-succinylbenzoate synthase [Opitutales bacterium]